MRATNKTLAALGLASVVLLGATACTSAKATEGTTATAVPTRPAAATTTAEATPKLTTLKHYVPTGQTLVTSADSMTGSSELGTFAVTTKNVYVYLSCQGPGVIRMDLKNIGSFPLNCSAKDPVASTNTFQVSAIKQYSVSIHSQPGQIWAVSVAIAK